MESIQEVIQVLKTHLEIPLEIDGQGGCCILLGEKLILNIDEEPSGRNVLLSAELGSVPPGAYRIRLFQSSLQANALPPPRYGILAFSPLEDTLILFEYLPLQPLDKNSLLEFLNVFVGKAQIWQDSLIEGSVPNVVGDQTKSPGLFNLG